MGHLVMERVLDWSAWTEPPRVGLEGVTRDAKPETARSGAAARPRGSKASPEGSAAAGSWRSARLPAATAAPKPSPSLLQRNYRGAIGVVTAVALLGAVATAYATRGRLEDLRRFPVPRLPASSTLGAPQLVAPTVVVRPEQPLAPGAGASDPGVLSLKLAGWIESEPAPKRAASKPASEAVVRAESLSPRPDAHSSAAPSEQAGPVEQTPVIERRDLGTSPEERADTAFRQGLAARQNGETRLAESRLVEALGLQPTHVGARQALAALLMDSQRMADLERVLREGTFHSPAHTAYAMAVARLEAERGDLIAAVVTLERAIKHAGEGNGELLALSGALLQRLDRHAEAADRYGAAIALGSANPVWFLGQAVSLRETGRIREARVRFRRAADSRALAPELRAYAQKQLDALGNG